jgi:hypothetical protein
MWDLLISRGAICIETGRVSSTAPAPLALLSGSFNPLHRGHTALAAVAAAKLGVPVHFELSATNVDKPELPKEIIEQRLSQFAGIGPVWVTRSATFVEKAALFPKVTFVVGWDTANRLIDPRYYGSAAGRDAALGALVEAGTRFVVGGRVDETGVFRVWEVRSVADEFAQLFLPLLERDFRVDVSSRALRERMPEG